MSRKATPARATKSEAISRGGDRAGSAEPKTSASEMDSLRDAARGCTQCTLHARATQTVFGEGDVPAAVMLVGEQPGDQEDLQGRPFVGPAGKLLDRALRDAGIERAGVYVTNAVKHFKWELRGKRRIHKKPSDREIAACSSWLEAEIRLAKPRCIVCMGATAARALLGPRFRVSVDRGKFVPSPHAPFVFATIHPSAVLRAVDDDARELAYQRLVSDLKLLHDALSPDDHGSVRCPGSQGV